MKKIRRTFEVADGQGQTQTVEHSEPEGVIIDNAFNSSAETHCGTGARGSRTFGSRSFARSTTRRHFSKVQLSGRTSVMPK